jgi:hypothetical protein
VVCVVNLSTKCPWGANVIPEDVEDPQSLQIQTRSRPDKLNARKSPSHRLPGQTFTAMWALVEISGKDIQRELLVK